MDTSAEPPSPAPPAATLLAGAHLYLVVDALHQISGRLPAHVDRDDLGGAGAVALVAAARQFDPTRGIDFAAFAAKRVSGAMLDELRRWDWAARSVRTEGRRRALVVEALEGRLGREPSTTELATGLGVSVDNLRRGERDSTRATVASLQNLTATETGHLPVAAATPADVLVAREGGAYLRDAVDMLPDRQRIAVVGHYLDGRPMVEIGIELGVTPSRVSQLCRVGLTHLHDGLAPYLLDEDPQVAADPGLAARRLRDYRSALATHTPWKTRLDRRPAPAARPETPDPLIA